jgi:hypothetical protein
MRVIRKLLNIAGLRLAVAVSRAVDAVAWCVNLCRGGT